MRSVSARMLTGDRRVANEWRGCRDGGQGEDHRFARRHCRRAWRGHPKPSGRRALRRPQLGRRRGLVERVATVGLKALPERGRDRVLVLEELRRVWDAGGELGRRAPSSGCWCCTASARARSPIWNGARFSVAKIAAQKRPACWSEGPDPATNIARCCPLPLSYLLCWPGLPVLLSCTASARDPGSVVWSPAPYGPAPVPLPPTQSPLPLTADDAGRWTNRSTSSCRCWSSSLQRTPPW